MEARLKRLRFRAHHMGTNENDILFGTFADKHLHELTTDQLDQFEALLDENDPNLFAWVTGLKPPPADLDTDVLQMIKNFNLAQYCVDRNQ